MPSALGIQQHKVGAFVAGCQAHGICPFAVFGRIAASNQAAKPVVVLQQIARVQRAIVHAAAQCAAAHAERIGAFFHINAAHQFGVDAHARIVEIAIARIQRVFFGIGQRYAVNAHAHAVAFHAAHGKAFAVARSALAHAHIGRIAHQIVVVADELAVDVFAFFVFGGVLLGKPFAAHLYVLQGLLGRSGNCLRRICRQYGKQADFEGWLDISHGVSLNKNYY